MEALEVNELSEYVYERDRHEFGLGDTLDIKTGLLLASLTFLAIQSGSLIESGLSLAQSVAQALSILFQIISGIFCVIELWPRDYEREAMPELYEAWITESEKFSREHPGLTIPTVSAARLSAAKQRIQTNNGINRAKSRMMFLAFYGLVLAFTSNLVTLTMRLF